MTDGDDSIVRRAWDGYQRRGDAFILRRISKINGLLPNPPILSGAALDGAVIAGARQLSIRADVATGRIVAGDKIILSGRILEVATDTAARAISQDPAVVAVPGFTNVPLVRALPISAADGAVLDFAWKGDSEIKGRVEAFDTSIGANGIIAGDLGVTIPSYGIDPPTIIDELLIDGRIRSIQSITPVLARGVAVTWHVHAR